MEGQEESQGAGGGEVPVVCPTGRSPRSRWRGRGSRGGRGWSKDGCKELPRNGLRNFTEGNTDGKRGMDSMEGDEWRGEGGGEELGVV